MASHLSEMDSVRRLVLYIFKEGIRKNQFCGRPPLQYNLQVA